MYMKQNKDKTIDEMNALIPNDDNKQSIKCLKKFQDDK